MNTYPEWWDTAVTIYNKYTDPETQIIQWYRHTVDGCFWALVGDKVNINDVAFETSGTICRIRKNDSFKEKYQWLELSDEGKAQFFTLGKGDIVVRGEVNDIVDEYVNGYHATDLINKYNELQGCMEIQRIKINTGAGRCSEHYYVKGE